MNGEILRRFAPQNDMTLLKKVISHHKDTKNTKATLIPTHKNDSLRNIISSVTSVSPW